MEVRYLTWSEDEDHAELWKLAERVYAEDPIWVPERLTGEIQRAWQQYGALPTVAVYEQEIIEARASWLLDADGQTGRIGLMEAASIAAGQAVLDACEIALRKRGARRVILSKWGNLDTGMVVAGFEQPQMVMTRHNPAYYPKIAAAQGYRIRQRSTSFLFSAQGGRLPHRLLPSLPVRSLSLDHLDRDICLFHRLQQAIFGDRSGYVPRSLAEDEQLVKGFLPFLDPDLVLFAEDKRGEAVGLVVCLPDIYQKLQGSSINQARIITIGALPGMRHRGVGVVLASALRERLLAKGYQRAEASWIVAENRPPQNLAARFGGSPGRRFAVWEKTLD